MMNRKQNLVKVAFNLPKSDWHEVPVETIWTVSLGEDRYKIDNIPFYIYGVSYQDIIYASLIDGQLVYKKIYKHSGHSTYRVFIEKNISGKTLKSFLQKLKKNKCNYERAFGDLYALDVPPTADINEVYSFLEECERKEILNFEEGHCGHLAIKKTSR